MGIFDIFKSDNNQSNQRKVGSPFELFSINFDSIPDSSFELVEEGKTEEGIQFKKHFKELPSIELGLFSQLEIIDFENGGKNYIFKGFQFNHQDINKVKVLVNSLFGFYGSDDTGSGGFDNNDLADLQDGFWTGRMWNSESFEPHIMISGDDEEGWSLTIWTK